MSRARIMGNEVFDGVVESGWSALQLEIVTISMLRSKKSL